MGKSKKNRAASQNQTQHKSQTSAEAFSFGDPIPVLDRRELLDYVECVQTDRWYEPPVSFDGLARTFRAAVHHSSPIAVKCNILTSTYILTRCSASRLFHVLCRTIWFLVTPTWRNALTASVKLSPLSLLWQNTPDAD